MGKIIVVFVLLFGGIALAVYLGLYVMLYGGIMAAVNNWGVDNSAVVCGIIRAVFFQVGALPGVITAYIGIVIGGSGLLRRSF